MLVPITELFDPDLLLLVEAGQSGEYINLTVDKLNDNESKVYDYILKAGGPTYLSDIWKDVFAGTDSKKANSWTRNALRRLVRSKFVNKIEKGVYTANKVSDDGYPEGVTDDEKKTKKGAKKKAAAEKPAEKPKASGPGLSDLSPAQVLAKLKDGTLSKEPEDLVALTKAGMLSAPAAISALGSLFPNLGSEAAGIAAIDLVNMGALSKDASGSAILDLAKSGMMSKKVAVNALASLYPDLDPEHIDFVVDAIHNQPDAKPTGEKALASLKKYGAKKTDLSKDSPQGILKKVSDQSVTPEEAAGELVKRFPKYDLDQMTLIVKSVAKGETSLAGAAHLLKTFGGGTPETVPSLANEPSPEPAPAPAGEPPSVADIMKQLGLDGEPPEPEPAPEPEPEPPPPPAPVKVSKPKDMSKVKTLDSLKFKKGKAKALEAVDIVAHELQVTTPLKGLNTVLSNVGRTIFTGDDIDADAVRTLVQSGEIGEDPTGLVGAFNDLDAKGSELGLILEDIAKAVHPDSPAQQMIMSTEMKGRRNTARRRFEQAVEKAYADLGKPGTYSVEDGFQPEGGPAKKGPKTKMVTYSGDELAAKSSIEVHDYNPKGGYSGPPKKTIKIEKTSGDQDDLRKFLKDLGIDPDTLPPIKDGNYTYMAFVPKDQWDKAKVTREEEIVQPGTHYKFKPYSGKPRYFPALSAGAPAPNNVSDIGKLNSKSKVPYNGIRYSSDGGAVEGQKINVRKFRNQSGQVEYVAEFKLRKSEWMGVSGGTSSKIERYNAKYDAEAGEFKISGTHSGGVDARKWSSEDGDVFLSTSDYTYSMMGTVHARIRAGDDVKGALRRMLNKMQTGLGDNVLRDPDPQEAELAKANALIWSENPAHARAKPSGASTVSDAMDVQGVNAKVMKETEKIEIMPGYSNFVRPGNWRKSKTIGGEASASFLLYACSTPNNVVNQLVNGMLGINERAAVGLGQFGASDSADVHSGCADNTLTRMVTKSASGHSPAHGSVSGPYQIIAPPDELDRLDAYYLHGDNFGACNPNDSHTGWSHRVSIKKSLDKQQSSYNTNGECGFRKGISAKRIMRVTCQDESNRQNLLEAMKKKGITEVNGVPAEDFVVVSHSCGDIYEKYVKPAGY